MSRNECAFLILKSLRRRIRVACSTRQDHNHRSSDVHGTLTVLSKYPQIKSSRIHLSIWPTVLAAILFAGCATNSSETRPFFRQELRVESHGRKTWFDHLVEVDPGGFKVELTPDYWREPPERIAVLPFTDRGSAQYVVDKIPLSFRDREQRANWAWTDANRLRRSLIGHLAQREFVPINLIQIDTVLADHGISNEEQLMRVEPQRFREWLGADAVIYGEVSHYEAYYAFLIAAWQVSAQMHMVSTHDGRELASARGSRFDVDLRPALTLEDIAINSALALLQLRDVVLARSEDEVCREIVLRIPESEALRGRLMEEARERYIEAQKSTTPSTMINPPRGVDPPQASHVP
jgi:hypothetical protein